MPAGVGLKPDSRQQVEVQFGKPVLVRQSDEAAHSYLTRIVRLALIAPSVVEAIIAGGLRSEVDVAKLTAPDAIPASWAAQEAKFLPARAV